jgi:hypothetical protein
VCREIKGQFQAWQQRRRLDEVALDYPFLDGSHFKYHANAAAESLHRTVRSGRAPSQDEAPVA